MEGRKLFRILTPALPAALAASAVLVCRFSRTAADFYAMKVYPAVSAVLSAISSPVPFSVNDVLIALFIAAALALLVLAAARRISWSEWALRCLTLALWVFVWFYAGWCTNYFRSDIFSRTESTRGEYDWQVFMRFLEDYTASLNDAWLPDMEAACGNIEESVKEFYGKVPGAFGLCTPRKWQHPKPMLARRLQSAVGVTGYMGPLACEFHINSDILPTSLPFTFAHEYAHLLGVSSEAEANWWAYQACRSSKDPAVRYSGYFSILAYVWNNALSLLGEEEFAQWCSTLRPEVIEDLAEESRHWKELRVPAVDKVQTFIYDLFLKANTISSGMKNYSEVVQMLLFLPDTSVKDQS